MHVAAWGVPLIIAFVCIAFALLPDVRPRSNTGVIIIAACLVVPLGYAIAFVLHTGFPVGTRRSTIVRWLTCLSALLVTMLAILQETAPHEFRSGAAKDGPVIRMEHAYLEFMGDIPEPTEHDKVHHSVPGYWRVRIPPLALIAAWLFPLLVPTLVESLNVRRAWRTPMRDVWRQWKEHRRRQLGLCLFCGYDMRGSRSGICPECGRQSRSGIEIERDASHAFLDASGRPSIDP